MIETAVQGGSGSTRRAGVVAPSRGIKSPIASQSKAKAVRNAAVYSPAVLLQRLDLKVF